MQADAVNCLPGVASGGPSPAVWGPILADTAAELAAGKTKVAESKAQACSGKCCTVVLKLIGACVWQSLSAIVFLACSRSCNRFTEAVRGKA